MKSSSLSKGRFLCLLSGHIGPFTYVDFWASSVSMIIWARCPISVEHMMSFWCPFLDSHLRTYHSNICVLPIIAMLNSCTSTLMDKYVTSAIGRNPTNFFPERFMDTDTGPLSKLDVSGQNFHFLPFGSGRHRCPAVSLATKFQAIPKHRLPTALY
jgi:hypothetical protein